MSHASHEWEKPENQTVYKGYNVYSGKKSGQGFIPEIVDWVIDAIDVVGCIHVRPVAFHIILDNPDFNKLSQLPKFLKRFFSRKPEDGHSDEVFYIIAHEIRPRSKQSHSHLWVFTDNLTTIERLNIQHKLVSQGYAKKARVACRRRDIFPDDWQGSWWYHSVRVEPEDLILRASYIAKYATKDQAKVRCWSSSQLPKAKPKPFDRTVTSLQDSQIEPDTLPLQGLALKLNCQQTTQQL